MVNGKHKKKKNFYIKSSVHNQCEVNLAATGDTMINQAVPPGRDSGLHSAELKLAISPNVGDSQGELCSHIHCTILGYQNVVYWNWCLALLFPGIGLLISYGTCK